MFSSATVRRIAGTLALCTIPALIGCAAKSVHLGIPVDEDPPAGEKIHLAVLVERPTSFTDSVLVYDGVWKVKVHYWDALDGIARRVPMAVFENVSAYDEPPADANDRLRLHPELTFLTHRITGEKMWDTEVTRAEIHWALVSAEEDTVWAMAFRGEASGKTGNFASSDDNLILRNEDAFAQAYEGSVHRMLFDPTLWLYADCAPLFEAPASEYPGIADRLLDAATSEGRRADALRAMLLFAAERVDLSLTAHLLALGADINRPFPYSGVTPLSSSLMSGHYEFAANLVELGADVDQPTGDGQTLLFSFALQGDEDAVVFLAERDAAIAPIDTSGFTAMASGRALAALATAAESRGDSASADRYYQEADSSYSRAAADFSDRAKGFASLKRQASVSGFMKELGRAALVSFVAWGEQYQAREQARQSAELAAMRQAKTSGAGIDGYYRYMNSYNASTRGEALASSMTNQSMLQLYDRANIAQWNEEREAEADTVDELKLIVEKYETLAELCAESTKAIRARSGR